VKGGEGVAGMRYGKRRKDKNKSPARKPDVLGTQVSLKTLRPGHLSIHFKIEGAHLSEVFGLSTNFPTTERIASMAYKSAMPIGMITGAGTHLVVQGTNRINGT
jgi:hypothetical protein